MLRELKRGLFAPNTRQDKLLQRHRSSATFWALVLGTNTYMAMMHGLPEVVLTNPSAKAEEFRTEARKAVDALEKKTGPIYDGMVKTCQADIAARVRQVAGEAPRLDAEKGAATVTLTDTERFPTLPGMRLTMGVEYDVAPCLASQGKVMREHFMQATAVELLPVHLMAGLVLALSFGAANNMAGAAGRASRRARELKL